jgi:hypothetical protein
MNEQFWRTLLYDCRMSAAANLREWVLAVLVLVAVLVLLQIPCSE